MKITALPRGKGSLGMKTIKDRVTFFSPLHRPAVAEVVIFLLFLNFKNIWLFDNFAHAYFVFWSNPPPFLLPRFPSHHFSLPPFWKSPTKPTYTTLSLCRVPGHLLGTKGLEQSTRGQAASQGLHPWGKLLLPPVIVMNYHYLFGGWLPLMFRLYKLPNKVLRRLNSSPLDAAGPSFCRSL